MWGRYSSIDYRGYRIEVNDYELEKHGGIKKILSAASRDEEETNRVLAALYSALREKEPSDDLSLKAWLLRHTDNRTVHAMFQCQATAFTGVNSSDFPAGEFIRFLRIYGRLRLHSSTMRGTGSSLPARWVPAVLP